MTINVYDDNKTINVEADSTIKVSPILNRVTVTPNTVITVLGKNKTSYPSKTTSTSVFDPTVTPDNPSGLTAEIVSFNAVKLKWSFTFSPLIRHTEIWRGTTNAIGLAELIGTSTGDTFTDALPAKGAYYYWIRYVTQAGKYSEYAPINGLLIDTTNTSVADYINALANELNESTLSQLLKDRLDLIEINRDKIDLVDANRISDRLVEATDRSTAIAAAVSQEATDRTAAINAAIAIEVGDRNAAIVSGLAVESDNRQAAILSEQTARVTADGAIAADVSTLQTVVGDSVNILEDNFFEKVAAGNTGIWPTHSAGNYEYSLTEGEASTARVKLFPSKTLTYAPHSKAQAGKPINAYVRAKANTAFNGVLTVNILEYDSNNQLIKTSSPILNYGFSSKDVWVSAEGSITTLGSTDSISVQVVTTGSTGFVEIDHVWFSETKYSGQFAILQETKKVTDGLNAYWGIKTNVNDLQGGVGLYNDGTNVDFAVMADRFYVLDPDNLPAEGSAIDQNLKVPFAIVNGEVMIPAAKIADLTADMIQAGIIDASIEMNSAVINAGIVNGGMIKGSTVYVGRALTNLVENPTFIGDKSPWVYSGVSFYSQATDPNTYYASLSANGGYIDSGFILVDASVLLEQGVSREELDLSFTYQYNKPATTSDGGVTVEIKGYDAELNEVGSLFYDYSSHTQFIEHASNFTFKYHYPTPITEDMKYITIRITNNMSYFLNVQNMSLYLLRSTVSANDHLEIQQNGTLIVSGSKGAAVINPDGSAEFSNLTASGNILANSIAGVVLSHARTQVDMGNNLGSTTFTYTQNSMAACVHRFQTHAFPFYNPNGVYMGEVDVSSNNLDTGCNWQFISQDMLINYVAGSEAYTLVRIISNDITAKVWSDDDNSLGGTTYCHISYRLYYQIKAREVGTDTYASGASWTDADGVVDAWTELSSGNSGPTGYKTYSQTKTLTIPETLSIPIDANQVRGIRLKYECGLRWGKDGGDGEWYPNGGIEWEIV